MLLEPENCATVLYLNSFRYHIWFNAGSFVEFYCVAYCGVLSIITTGTYINPLSTHKAMILPYYVRIPFNRYLLKLDTY